MKKEWQKKYWIFLGIVLLIFVGTSYALFSEVIIGQKKYSIESRGLKLLLNEKNDTQEIVLSNVIPTTDDKGMENRIYDFSLINSEEEDLAYTIYLKEEEYENKTPASAIRYNYTRDIGNIDITRNLDEQQTGDGRYYLETGIIPAKNTYNYQFVMWIGYEAGNEILGTKCTLSLEVEAKQTIDLYQEEILRGTDPVLSSNLVPVVIEENGEVKKASLFQEWYNYSKQRWANAVVLEDNTIKYKAGDRIPEANIESYFVWIPRYKYKIFDEGNYNGIVTNVENAVQTIEVEFETKEAVISNGNKVGEWLSHPAFQAFDSNGFWVGKFESGYKGATTTVGAQMNSSDSSKLQIKPNVYSWRGITVGNAFKASYDYLRNEESHMMKNTEWGAVAYLQHSEYGSRSSVRVNNNNSYITGYAAVKEPTCGYNKGESIECNLVGTDSSVTLPYNTSIGYTSSTTGNITGIYDMSGGAWEYVMGYNINASVVGGESGLTNTYENFFTSDQWNQYYDKYSNSTGSDSVYNMRILGDATAEMGPFANVIDPDKNPKHRSSWYGDYGYTVYLAQPWFSRGGNCANGVLAGGFSVNNGSGGASQVNSFRVVLVP